MIYINVLKYYSLVYVITHNSQLTTALWNFKILFTWSSPVFLYRLCYVVIYEVVLLYYFMSVYSSFLLYLVWVFCLIRLALCCSLKLF
jgi:hypothetical protein